MYGHNVKLLCCTINIHKYVTFCLFDSRFIYGRFCFVVRRINMRCSTACSQTYFCKSFTKLTKKSISHLPADDFVNILWEKPFLYSAFFAAEEVNYGMLKMWCWFAVVSFHFVHYCFNLSRLDGYYSLLYMATISSGAISS